MQNLFKNSKNSKKIESKIRKALYEFEMLKDINSLAIALSGGKDSLTLLYMLSKIIGNGFDNIKLIAIHIDGSFSCGANVSKKYLSDICKSLNVEFVTQTLDIPYDKLNCYSCSRDRRRLIFDISKKNDCSTIAFGHHRDDNIQTLLLNLFHKAEFASMMPKIKFKKISSTIIRPLIFVEEQEIITFAKVNNFLKTTCQCPFGNSTNRKKIDKIINQIEFDFPNIRNNLSLSSFTYGSKKALDI
ncbi:MAG: tRNA 2-thiocytidine biosynthesis protein TtcA [Candidatus Anoxychlamydiales bacterium]|nr:tRNA 2-thiocytidine biosynthesis protein TtcA [Candidatus Anoxychlamydiales bacterium]